jgi:hypothetical protein
MKFRTLNRLSKEGRLETPKTWITMRRPDGKEENRVILYLTLKGSNHDSNAVLA